MKRIFLILFLPLFLYSAQIDFDKSFIKTVINDELSTSITIKLTRNSEDDVASILNKYNDLINQANSIKKQKGNFSVHPKYVYHKANSKIVGYNGVLSYTVSSNSSKIMNDFIKELLYSKDEKNLSIIISSLSWKISYELEQKELNSLRLESITWSKQYEEELSLKLNTKCITKNININKSSSQRPIYPMSRTMSDMSVGFNKNLAIPKNSKNKITLNANYIMECK